MGERYASYPSLAGKVVLVTGGASGIGEAFVTGFHGQGAKVAFIDIDGAAGEALAERLPGAWFRSCDVTDEHALRGAIEAAAGELGPVAVLINNVANDTRRAAVDFTADQWRASLAVNLDAAFIAATAVHGGMARAGEGVIVNLSSINPLLGLAGMASYVAAKGAINALSKSLAREWGSDGIRVNAVSPGWVVTPRQLELWLSPEAEAAWMQQVSLKRRILPEDVARLVLFLSSDDSAMITGQNLVIDAGRT